MSGRRRFNLDLGEGFILLALVLMGIITFMGAPSSRTVPAAAAETSMTRPADLPRDPVPEDPFKLALPADENEGQHAAAMNMEPLPDVQPAAEQAPFTVTVRVAGGQGMVSPVHQVVAAGNRAEVTFTPSPGYRIETLSDNGRPRIAAGAYVIGSVTENHELTVTFINYAPQVTLIEPGEGMPVLGRVTVRAQIVDDEDLAAAELLVNGVVVQRTRKPAPQIIPEGRIPGFIQTEDFTFAASPGGLQLSEDGSLRQILDDGRPVPLLCPDFELRDLQVLPERGWLLLSFGHDLSDSFGQRSPVLLLDPSRSRASGLVSSGFEILPSSVPGREPFELQEDGSLTFSVRDTLTGERSQAVWSAAEGRRFSPYSPTGMPSPLPRSQIAWLDFSPEDDPQAQESVDQIWTFTFDSLAEPAGPLDLVVRAWDRADALGQSAVTVHQTPVELTLSGQRQTVTIGSVSRPYGWLHLAIAAPDGSIDRLRLMRRTGNGTFVPQITFTPEQLAGRGLDYADKYLDHDRVYRYRLEALDAAGRVLGQSEEVDL